MAKRPGESSKAADGSSKQGYDELVIEKRVDRHHAGNPGLPESLHSIGSLGMLTRVSSLLRVFALAGRGLIAILRRSALLCVVCSIIQSAGKAETPFLTNAWSYGLHYYSDSSPAVGDDGTIYFGVSNGDFWAFRPDGTPKWTFHTEREIKSSPALGSDGTLYFGCRDRKLYAVGPDGRKKWAYPTGAWVDSSPALATNGTIYFGSWDKNFYALNPDGSEQWHFASAGEIVSSAAVGVDGIIYFGSHDHNAYALLPHGKLAWQYTTGAAIVSSPALDQDGTVYLTSTDGFFYAFKPGGGLKWRLKTGGITDSSVVIGQDGTLYVGANKTLWAISTDGMKKWEQLYGDLIDASPLALADNTICCASRQGALVNQEAPNAFHWFYGQNWPVTAPPAIGSNGQIYAMAHVESGIVLNAIQIQVKLAQSPWPKFRGDERNSGRQKTYTR